MSIANREQLLNWIQKPIPRNSEDVEVFITLAKRQINKPYYIGLSLGVIALVLASIATVWVEEILETREVVLIALYALAVIYALPACFFYYRAHKRIIKLATTGDYGKAVVKKVFHDPAKRFCKIYFEYTASNHSLWIGSAKFSTPNSGIKVTDSIPMLSHVQCGRKAFLLTPAQGLVLANVKPATEITWLRWLILSFFGLVLLALPIILAQLVAVVLIMQALFG